MKPRHWIVAGAGVGFVVIVGALIFKGRRDGAAEAARQCQKHLDDARTATISVEMKQYRDLAWKSCGPERRPELKVLDEKVANMKARDDANRIAGERKIAAVRAAEQRRIADMPLPEAAKEWTHLMGDSFGGQDTQGTIKFREWSLLHMNWRGLQEVRRTTVGHVMKDSKSERGRLVCMRGHVAQITKVEDWFDGAITRSYGQEIIRFVAIGDTGDIIQGSRARFCGVVTGIYGYTDVTGGQAQTVRAVGMFDLPRNR